MDEIRWGIAALFFVLFIWLASMNAYLFWNSFVRKKKTSSWIPVIGGACGALSLSIVPLQSAGAWWWLPLILDWGSIPGILVSLGYALSRSRRKDCD
jgi:hypothetical protein